jgi:hypothetical protein
MSYVMSTTPRVDGSAPAHRPARVSRSCSNLDDGQPAWLALHARAHLVMSAIAAAAGISIDGGALGVDA